MPQRPDVAFSPHHQIRLRLRLGLGFGLGLVARKVGGDCAGEPQTQWTSGSCVPLALLPLFAGCFAGCTHITRHV